MTPVSQISREAGREDPLRRAPIAVLAAVERELRPLRAQLRDARPGSVGRKPNTAGLLGPTPVVLMATGIGRTNAAQALTALLEGEPVLGVLNVGVGGAYPGSELEVGGVALATEEIYGDDGVEAPSGWISTESIGIPLLQTPEHRHFNRFPLDGGLVARAATHLAARGMTVVAGPFVTVSCCSGTARRGAELASAFGAVCESMEGAALAHVSALYGVPFLEVRGISNLVEDRDLSRWRLAAAAVAGSEAARAVIDVFPGTAVPAP